jgi:hypothetical protein
MKGENLQLRVYSRFLTLLSLMATLATTEFNGKDTSMNAKKKVSSFHYGKKEHYKSLEPNAT